MAINDWFRFETAKERKKRQEKYFNKMFPMGKEQQDWEEKTLRGLFPEKKDIRQYHFLLLTLREGLTNADDPGRDEDDPDREEAIRRWGKNQFVRDTPEEVVKRIRAMAFLEHDCRASEELPALEAVFEYVQKNG